MDTTEGGALVEDNRSIGVGETRFPTVHARCNTNIATILGRSVAFGTPEFHRTRSFRAKKRLVNQGVGAVRFVPR
ncbi:hypothetical protein R1flu_008163 [Riccia fluitans]|uniref:Uncharacterized protein n=1 Tax=Riccia fluitans TaxID=41844 RepID=A0ABD1YAX8_9MARC